MDRIAEMNGGNVQPRSITRTRWYIDDIESATLECDQGRMKTAAQLMRAASSDGVVMGLMSTRTAGLVRLPKRWRGDGEMIKALTGGEYRARAVFDEMCPAAELALLAADGDKLGVGVGQMLTVEGRTHKRLCRLDPEFLVFNWAENQWYYQSVGGMLAITPGDGTWVLHIPGGTLDKIKETLTQGRVGQMPPMAAAVGTPEDVRNVAHYVLSLSGSPHDSLRASLGKSKFGACAACHGMDGKGNQTMGAPNLTDDIWLHGWGENAIVNMINNGKVNQMPAQAAKLTEGQIHVLASYVWGLSNKTAAAGK